MALNKKSKPISPHGDADANGNVRVNDFTGIEGNHMAGAHSTWKFEENWNTPSRLNWRKFGARTIQLPYTLPQFQNRIDDAEPENMYNNASGCGTPPLFPIGAMGKKKLADYRACTANANSAQQNLDNALAAATLAKANQSQSTGLSTGAIVAILATISIVGVGAWFLLKK